MFYRVYSIVILVKLYISEILKDLTAASFLGIDCRIPCMNSAPCCQLTWYELFLILNNPPNISLQYSTLKPSSSQRSKSQTQSAKMAEQKSKKDGPIGVSQYDIRELTSSEEDIQQAWKLWHAIFPDWPIDQDRFPGLLVGIKGQHWIHEHGFCLSYYSKSGSLGHVAAIGVLPEYRRQGLGNALLEKGKKGLKDAAKKAGQKLNSLAMGSIFPRFWYQVPASISLEAKQFLTYRGQSLITGTLGYS